MLFCFSCFFSNFIVLFNILSHFSKIDKNKNLKDKVPIFSILIGKDLSNNDIYIPESSLYQNLLITGCIGSGKTSSAMYPFTKQLIKLFSNNVHKKLGFLILDVKGNYYNKIVSFARECNRLQDIIVIELNGKYKYNPLDKPNLKASVLANRLKEILLLFSPNNTESYWLDKTEQILECCINLCRIYNNNYVSFSELHNLVTNYSYYDSKVKEVRKIFLSGKLSFNDIYNLYSSISFLENDYFKLDERTFNILKSEITRITNCFVSDYEVKNTFCPEKHLQNFYGFEEVIKEGKIVVLNMNIAKYKNLSKIVAAYLKLDFQTDILKQLSNPSNHLRTMVFISDEYQEYITSSDANFFSQSREAHCINIVATQSYSSLYNTLQNNNSTNVIIQNLINKLCFRTDDIATIEIFQKQIGKESQKRISKTITENAKESSYNYLFHKFTSLNSNLSESINTYYQTDFKYDYNFFTQQLETFSCIAFLSDGNKIMNPQKIKMLPYFYKED